MWLWSSKLMSKSPVKKRGSRDKIMGSKKSENSSIKLIIVTRLVLRVRSTIYYSQCKAWISKIWWRPFGTFKRRSWTKLGFAKNRPKSSLLLFFLISFSCSNVWMVLLISMFMILFPFFILRASPRKGSWGAVRTRPIGSTTFYVCFAIWIIVLAVSYTFDFYRVLYYSTGIIWVIPNKAIEKNK